MIFILKGVIIVLLFIIVRNISNYKLSKKIRSQIFEGEGYKSTEKFIKEDRISWLILSFLFGVLAIIAGNTIKTGIICIILSYSLFYTSKVIKMNSIKKQVLQDLLNVVECLRVQVSANISLDVALRNLPNLCKNKEFSAELRNLCLEYELSKFTISSSIKQLESKFNYPEIRMFISAIKQQCQHTSAFEAFDNLISVLKERYIEYMEDSTRTKSVIMILGVCIVVVNLALMSVYPIIIEASDALKVMLIN